MGIDIKFVRLTMEDGSHFPLVAWKFDERRPHRRRFIGYLYPLALEVTLPLHVGVSAEKAAAERIMRLLSEARSSDTPTEVDLRKATSVESKTG